MTSVSRYNPMASPQANFMAYSQSVANRQREIQSQKMQDASRLYGNTLVNQMFNDRTPLLRSAPTHTSDITDISYFHEIVKNGGASCVREALAEKPSLATVRYAPDGETPLHIAAEKGHVTTLLILIDAKAPIEGKNDAGITPLGVAAKANQKETVSRLLAAGANPDNPNKQGETPLFIAALKADYAVFSMIAAKSKNLSAVRNDGTNTFMALHLDQTLKKR